MASDAHDNPAGGPDQAGEHGRPRPPRRQRYRGTHPGRFGQRYKELDPQHYPQMQQHVRQQGRTPAGTHVPVLLEEVLAHLRPAAGEVVVDCTIGYGGHAREFLRRIGPSGRLIGMDLDAAQLARTAERFRQDNLTAGLHHGNFAGIAKVLGLEGLDGCDVLFADLGLSSMQVDDPDRGFSYKHDGPLDMRMDSRLRESAADLLARLSEEELSRALWELADESDHLRIARAIVTARTRTPLTRTAQLVELVRRAKRFRTGAPPSAPGRPALHPAARTFQALRILVNDELGTLRHLLRIAPSCLRPGGRIGIISFHSGEDRLVKQAFREGLATGAYAAVSPEPIRPAPAEARSNRRAAPPRLRWAVRAG